MSKEKEKPSKDAQILALILEVKELKDNLKELREDLMIPEKKKRPKLMW